MSRLCWIILDVPLLIYTVSHFSQLLVLLGLFFYFKIEGSRS